MAALHPMLSFTDGHRAVSSFLVTSDVPFYLSPVNSAPIEIQYDLEQTDRHTDRVPRR